MSYVWQDLSKNTKQKRLLILSTTPLQGRYDFSPLTSAEAVSLHYCAGDAKLFEGCHTQRAPQVTGRPDESIRCCNGDSRLTGWQDHHYCLEVWDGEASVLPKTPDKRAHAHTHTHTHKKRGGRGYRTGQHLHS